jgi:hypothetical protein
MSLGGSSGLPFQRAVQATASGTKRLHRDLRTLTAGSPLRLLFAAVTGVARRPRAAAVAHGDRRHWYFNAGAKWIMLRSDVKFDGDRISRVRIDPVLLGLGFGYRFGGR